MSASEPVSWSVLEGYLRGRPRWRRIGREWHGPCPVRGVGDNTCWFGPGERTPVRGGCRKCGGRLSSPDFREHLAAVVGDLAAASAASSGGTPAVRVSVQTRRNPLPGRVWSASVAVATDSPGFRYLRTRGVVAAAGRVPPSVRWLPLRAAVSVRCAPRLPATCAGALVYRFAGPGEAETWAVQFEPVDEGGRRLACSVRGVPIKRPSVAGSCFALGRRVFSADGGTPGKGCWLVEGPLDALAVCRLDALGQLCRLDACGRLRPQPLAGAAVFGVAGVPGGFRSRACWSRGPVVLAPDADKAGIDAALRLGTELGLQGRGHIVVRPPYGSDWSDFALDEGIEREGVVEY